MDTDLMLAFFKAGWTHTEIKKLCNDKLLAHLLPLVREYDETTTAQKGGQFALPFVQPAERTS